MLLPAKSNHLDIYVKGQQQAKKAIALARYNHLLYLAYRETLYQYI